MQPGRCSSVTTGRGVRARAARPVASVGVEPAELVGLLAEPERLRVVAAMVLGARTHAQIAERSGLDPKAVAAALRRLHTGGLIEDAPGGYVLRTALFKEAARAA
ncbi:MAG: hypothetical protein QOD04_2675, partial [Pseudonocardiales bacterium]|nr:hypothetical protein [Pseudonocardiales bacterium]